MYKRQASPARTDVGGPTLRNASHENQRARELDARLAQRLDRIAEADKAVTVARLQTDAERAARERSRERAERERAALEARADGLQLQLDAERNSRPLSAAERDASGGFPRPLMHRAAVQAGTW